MLGKYHTEETRRKISKANLGKKLRPETIAKILLSKKGFKHSEETKRKMRKSALGKVFSLTHRENLSKALKGKKKNRKIRNENS